MGLFSGNVALFRIMCTCCRTGAQFTTFRSIRTRGSDVREIEPWRTKHLNEQRVVVTRDWEERPVEHGVWCKAVDLQIALVRKKCKEKDYVSVFDAMPNQPDEVTLSLQRCMPLRILLHRGTE
jgi:hypothetical protein